MNTETVQMRIDRLKNLVAQLSLGKEATDKIKLLREVVPRIIKSAENSIQTKSKKLLGQLEDFLIQTEILLQWAVFEFEDDETTN